MGRLMGSSNSNNYGEQIFIMQIVYYLYDQCYNRYNSHGSVINTCLLYTSDAADEL